MKTRLANLWERVRNSFWAIPALMIIFAVGLSYGAVAIDRSIDGSELEGHFGVYSGGGDGARGLLQAIAGSMISVAGIVFSITIATLSLASSQFGPRIIRSFIRDAWNQMVLGTFVATFIYSLLVLRTVRTDDTIFVPYVSVTVAILLALASIGVLIFFIHHLSMMLIAPNVIAAVAKELHGTIKKVTKERRQQVEEDSNQEEDLPPDFEKRALTVASSKSGYLQAVDTPSLMSIASKNDLILQIAHRPGDFVVEGRPLMAVWPGEQAEPGLVKQMQGSFIFGPQRTLEQDLEYGMQQLVDVALRALSPSLNDTFTAATCINHIGAGLSRLARRDFPEAYRYDDEGRLRVITKSFAFPGIVDLAFNHIRENSRQNVAISVRLLEVIAVVAASVTRDKDRFALLRQAQMIESASRELPEPGDRMDVEERYRVAVSALGY